MARRGLDERERQLALAFLDGELSEQESLEFELSLAEDSSLAQSFEELGGQDEIARMLAAARPSQGSVHISRGRRAAPWIALAAALVALALFARPGLRSGSPGEPPAIRVALLASSSSVNDYASVLGMNLRLESSVRGGSEADTNPMAAPASRFVPALLRAQEERAVVALDEEARSVVANQYRLALNLASESYLLLIADSDSRGLHLRRPKEGEPSITLAAGFQVYPPSYVSGDEDETYSPYGRPLLVLRDESELRLWVALRPAAEGEPDLALVRKELAELRETFVAHDPQDPERTRVVRSYLEERGYALTTLVVRELPD